MPTRTWEERLAAAVHAEMQRSKRSMRSISLDAGLGPNNVREVINDGKKPLAENVVKIARECHVSLTWIYVGVDISPEDEQLLAMVSELGEEKKKNLLSLLSSFPTGAASQS